MADKKITQLANITGAALADADEFVVVDISSDETKSITLAEFKTALDTGSGFVRVTGDTMTGALILDANPSANLGAATKQYVDSQVATADTLAEVLGLGNTTGGTNLVVSTGDEIELPDGSNTVPSITNTGDTNTGMYFGAADTVSFTTGGTKRLDVHPYGISVIGALSVTDAATTRTNLDVDQAGEALAFAIALG